MISLQCILILIAIGRTCGMCIHFRFSTSKAKGQKHMSVRMAGCMRHLQVCFSMWFLVCVQGMSSVLTMN